MSPAPPRTSSGPNSSASAPLAWSRSAAPRGDDCGDYNWVPYPACRSCLSENQTWSPVSGDATVYTFTVRHRGPGAFNAEVPYVIALGELAEQPRPCLVLGNLVGTAPEDVRVGMPFPSSALKECTLKQGPYDILYAAS
jgi:uncharacterized OB-fold protein